MQIQPLPCDQMTLQKPSLSGGDLNKVAIAATDQTVKTNPNTAHVGIQEDIDMTYGVATSAAQAQGTYQDVIVYTATAL